MKHRTRTDVISQILDAANGSDATRSRLAYKASLSYNQLRENLMALIEKNLLRYDRNTKTFRTNEKGLKFLQLYNEINELINEEEEGHPQQVWMQR